MKKLFENWRSYLKEGVTRRRGAEGQDERAAELGLRGDQYRKIFEFDFLGADGPVILDLETFDTASLSFKEIRVFKDKVEKKWVILCQDGAPGFPQCADLKGPIKGPEDLYSNERSTDNLRSAGNQVIKPDEAMKKINFDNTQVQNALESQLNWANERGLSDETAVWIKVGGGGSCRRRPCPAWPMTIGDLRAYYNPEILKKRSLTRVPVYLENN